MVQWLNHARRSIEELSNIWRPKGSCENFFFVPCWRDRRPGSVSRSSSHLMLWTETFWTWWLFSSAFHVSASWVTRMMDKVFHVRVAWVHSVVRGCPPAVGLRHFGFLSFWPYKRRDTPHFIHYVVIISLDINALVLMIDKRNLRRTMMQKAEKIQVMCFGFFFICIRIFC